VPHSNKTKDIAIYLIYALFPAVTYGFFAFFVIYRGLAGENMLYSYLWNILFIAVLISIDKFANDVLLSKDFVITKNNYIVAAIIHTVSFISFKTSLYLFYIFVLIVSRISILAPDSIPPEFQNFVLSVEYCLILLVVFDKFLEYLMKDSVRIKRISSKFTSFAKFVSAKKDKFTTSRKARKTNKNRSN